MYCNMCGQKLNENGICINCNRSSGEFAAEKQSYIGLSNTTALDQCKKSVWFAPVATLLNVLLSFGLSFLSNYYILSANSEDLYHERIIIATGISNLTKITLMFIICFALYFGAFSNFSSEFKAKNIGLAFIPIEYELFSPG